MYTIVTDIMLPLCGFHRDMHNICHEGEYKELGRGNLSSINTEPFTA